MAIGLGAALLGSAVIGGVGTAIGASSNSRAIRSAQQAQSASDAQAIAAQERARAENTRMQQPFYQTGMAANNRINALLGLSTQQPQNAMLPQMGGLTPNLTGGYNDYAFGGGYGGMRIMNENPMIYGDIGVPPSAPTMTGGQSNELAAAENAFGDWRNNTGYNFRFNEGIKAIDAGAPVRNSGATLKARMRFGQDIGSQEYWNYFGALQDQQRVGVGAANALSGVGTNYADNISRIAQNSGNNAANAAMARANNTNALIGGLTSSFNNALGAYGAFGGFG
jgi:hypothetical protein